MSSNQNLEILSTDDAARALRWNMLLDLQVAEFLPFEIHAYLKSQGWREARSVLDVGCGNGAYLERLRTFFPEKTYVGIDVSPELIAAGRNNPSLEGVTLVESDLYDYTASEPFDAIVLRLVLQHFSDPARLLNKLSQLLCANGRLFVLEPDPAQSHNYPETPKFTELLKNYGRDSARRNLNRGRLDDIEKHLARLPGWDLVENKVMISAQTGPFSHGSLMQIFSLWLDIFETSGIVHTDFAAVRQELDDWSKGDNAFSAFGIRFIELKRTPNKLGQRFKWLWPKG